MSPSKFRLRRVFRKPVLMAAGPFIKRDVHPNTITYTSLLFAFFGFLILVFTQNQMIFGVLVFTVGFLDGVDGAVARATNKASKKGAFTDSIVDKLSEGIILLAIPLAFPSIEVLGLNIELWAFACITSWLLTSYSRARAEPLGVQDLDIGLGARSERLFILFLFSVISLLIIGLIVVTIVGIATAVYRVAHYRNQIVAQTSE
ncbi:MAG: CDP-alcohol phosphatidyltransferase family protein [Candidatus Thorarchaeota archaeon]